MPTAEEYAEMMANQAKQYQDMIDSFMQQQQEQINSVINSTVSGNRVPEKPKEPAQIYENITSVWITGEDGEQYLLMSKDAANLLFDMIEKTAAGLQEIAKDVS